MVKRTVGTLDIDITGLQMDSRKVEKGNLFICVPAIEGFLQDRHLFANDAIQNGAVALVLERDMDVDVPKIFVKDARHAMAVIAAHFYHYPSQQMNLIAITGTNGKTTTSFIIEKILSDYGLKTGLMGNNGVKMNGTMHPTDINTQESPILQRNLRRMRDEHIRHCVMEVSSQGIDTKRVLGCHFKTAVFTNLTQDHLDYHGTFEEYRNTKGRLFSSLGNSYSPKERKYVVINADDPSSEYFRKVSTAEVVTYGINNTADVTAKNISMTSKGIQFLLSSFEGEIQMDLQLVGRFNIYNALAGITAALLEGIPLENIKKSLSELKSVDGRMEIVDEDQEFLVLVDYAHTPDALENALKTIKEFATGNVITVFGCGGDRDTAKRPIMGELASQYSDFIVVTSDNPRSEDPIKILQDIEMGIKEANFSQYELVVDREEAIHKAIKLANHKDIVLIAGKGHETYQVLKDQTVPFDDKVIAREAITQK